ncbi:hypothetical protein AGMMS49975_06150 [Clostridia bacterium]|nr:hypothetical protein AGMMS49975_06150 [Clostridia bacterium]
MDAQSMQQATQEAVKKKFGRKRLLTSKVVTHYPENLEREYARLTNSYMSLFSNTLKTYLPKIRATLEDYERSGFIMDMADNDSQISNKELIAKANAIADEDGRIKGVIPFVGKETQDKVRAVPFDALKAEKRMIPLSELATAQRGVDEDHVVDLINAGVLDITSPIEVNIVNGQYVIKDGNHRAILAKLRGQKEIYAQVANLDTPPVTHSVAVIAATNIKLERLFAEVLADFEKRQNNFNVASRIEKLSNLTRKLTVKEWKRVVKNTLGIDIMEDYYNGAKFQRLFDSWIADNVAKIKAIPNETIVSMRNIVKQGYLNGIPAVKRDFAVQRKLKDGTVTTVTLHSKQPTIAEQIQEAYQISKEHAQLIARGQMAKLNAQISQEQMNDAGVTEYVWRAVNDGRTRACHKSLNGKRFMFAVGAEQWYDTKSKGRVSTGYANPGEYYQCRCVALPVFDLDTVVLPWEKGEAK